ncbi:MAG: hypothetical protein IJ833_01320 [Lachnospiraceae bacterium]|nr:hypothetical protein [Lachnospiraceae bacterium]
MEEKKQNKERRVIIVLLLLILLLLLAGGIFFLVKMLGGKEETPQGEQPAVLGYEGSAVMADPETLQSMVDEMFAKAKEGQMVLEMATEAYSEDGETFVCNLANAVENSYDMYIVLYENETQDELYRSGLIPTGARIETLTVNKQFSKGSHACTVTFVQMEDDHATEHARVNVAVDLIVQ